MNKAQLNDELIATVAGDVTVFNYYYETREYCSASVEQLVPGIGIPANSCIDAPPEPKIGYVICRTRDFTRWEYIADHRGETVYSIKDGTAVEISLLGDYPADTTSLMPATPYDVWNGNAWITDTQAQHTAQVKAAEHEKQTLLSAAQSAINIWQSKLLLGRISDSEKIKLNSWLDYVDALQGMDVSPATEIRWPSRPAE